MDSHAALRFLCEPCDPQVQTFWHSLDDDAKEYFDERAAIAEYEAGLSRTEAEAMAMRLTVAYRQRRESGRNALLPDGRQTNRAV